MTYAILGARGQVEDPDATVRRIQEWASRSHSEIMVADARSIFGRDHIETALRHALRAQASGTMVSRSVAMETLRYLAAQRQVADAIRVSGIRRGTREIAIVAIGTDSVEPMLQALGWTRDDSVLEAGRKSVTVLGVSRAELATVLPGQQSDLVLEKVALLDVLK